MALILSTNTLSEPYAPSPSVKMASPAEIITAAFISSSAGISSPRSKKAVGPVTPAARLLTCMAASSRIMPSSNACASVSSAGSLESPATLSASPSLAPQSMDAPAPSTSTAARTPSGNVQPSSARARRPAGRQSSARQHTITSNRLHI